MSTNVEEVVEARRAVEKAEEKLRAAKGAADGITRMTRAEWDALTDNQKAPLIPAVKARTLILIDVDEN